jgi:hypothetical protein
MRPVSLDDGRLPFTASKREKWAQGKGFRCCLARAASLLQDNFCTDQK